MIYFLVHVISINTSYKCFSSVIISSLYDSESSKTWRTIHWGSKTDKQNKVINVYVKPGIYRNLNIDWVNLHFYLEFFFF